MSFLSNNPISREINRERVFGLDILRALAIFFVLMGHGSLFMPMRFQVLQWMLIPIDAVSLFFVLSGFLIGRILIDTFSKREIGIRTVVVFWSRRWLRTLPAYFAMLLLLAVVYQKFDKSFLLKYALFIQNFKTPLPEWFAESWSLTIEEWFYLLTPMVLFVLIKIAKLKTPHAFLVMCLGFMIVFPAFRLYRYFHMSLPLQHRVWDFYFRMQVVTRLDAIMYGVFGAYIYRYYRQVWEQQKKKRAIIGTIIILVNRCIAYYFAITQVGALYNSVFCFCVDSIAILMLMPYFESLKKGKGKIGKVVTFISVISYSLYLVNFALVSLWIMYIFPHFGLTGNSYYAMKYGVYWIISFVLAVCLYLAVEYPYLQFRDKFIEVDHRKID